MREQGREDEITATMGAADTNSKPHVDNVEGSSGSGSVRDADAPGKESCSGSSEGLTLAELQSRSSS